MQIQNNSILYHWVKVFTNLNDPLYTLGV